MPVNAKSSVIDNLKPINVFYVWYTELCRRYNSSPLSIVKPAKPKKETVLDFFGDRIKAEEWLPVLNALRKDTSLHIIAVRSRAECEFFHDVDTEQKVRRMKRRYGSLRTDFILKTLLKSLSCVLRNTQVLTSLELDGLPITKDYLKFLAVALETNKTVKNLSFKHSQLRDDGCELLCRSLRFAANVEILNLTGCGLSVSSAYHLAKLINYQQTKRYCECWHNSLRYEEPEVDVMCGLKRITLNNNPDIGDEGLSHILDVLIDDLWMKAIDMQKCNVSDNIASRVLDVINYNRSLQIFDLRHNIRLSPITLDKIFDSLKQKQQLNFSADYQWCLTTSTLSYNNSFCDDSSNRTSSVQKSRSAPMQQNDTPTTAASLRRIKTMTNIKRSSQYNQSKQKLYQDQTKNDMVGLNAKLQEEVARRKKVEQANFELKKTLEHIKSVGNLHNQPMDKLNQRLKVIEENHIKEKPPLSDLKVVLNNKPKVKLSSINTKNLKETQGTTNCVNEKKEPTIKFIFSPSHKSSAQNIFENILSKGHSVDSEDEVTDLHANTRRYQNTSFKAESKASSFYMREDDESDLTASNASLLRLVEEIANDETTSTSSNERRPAVSTKKVDTSWVKVW